MRIDTGFRLALYLSLGFACLCLSYAEQDFVPRVFVVTGPTLVLLVVAWWADGKWSLSSRAANILGGVITVGIGIWLASRLRQTEDIARDPLVWLPSSLPYLGPLLMAVMVAKVFRAKQERDYWLLQAIGFIHVVLACVLATGMAMGPFLAGYVFCALWCLVLFTLRCCLAQRGEAVVIPWRLLGLFRVGRWAAVTMLLGLTLFLATPRATEGQWNAFSLVPGAHRGHREGRTGHGEGIDLNSTGSISVDAEPAFFVTVTEDREGTQPKLDLSEEQRWRGIVLDRYIDGRWRSGIGPTLITSTPPSFLGGRGMRELPGGLLVPEPAPEPQPARFELIDLGPDQFYVTFRYWPARAGGLFLADPLVLPQGLKCMPMIPLEGLPLFAASLVQATFIPRMRGSDIRTEVTYRQVTIPAREGEVSPALGIDPEYHRQLTQQPVEGISTWTLDLLRRLAAQPSSGVTKADVDCVAARQELPPERQQPVAQALCAYLAHAPEFGYTLDRPRKDLSIDPTLDFLVNVKQGHCERFASALALLLRSAGVPARIVKGFRGAEGLGDGQYQVRQSDAHSWVEALVTHLRPDGTPQMGWLTLDPTPFGDAPTAVTFSLSRWWSLHWLDLELFWREFILNYSPETRQTLAQGISQRLGVEKGWGALQRSGHAWTSLTVAVGSPLLLLAGVWTVRRFRLRTRRRTRPAPRAATLPCYTRLLALMQRTCDLAPLPAQTPREFSDVARVHLLRGAGTAPLAEVPAHVVALLYRTRYGGQPLSPEEVGAVDGRLDQLDRALKADKGIR